MSNPVARPLPGTTEIAGKKTVDCWKQLCAELKTTATQELWEKAFDEFFLARLAHRYFKPIEALEAQKLYEGEGFSIVAIQCSLIEFLESTYQGKVYKYDKPDDKLHEYKDSKNKFLSFLKNREPFKSEFVDATRNWPKEFYEGVRCGLLHEAGTRGGWRIHFDQNAPTIFDKTKLVIYRNKLKDALYDYLSRYRAELLTDPALQQAFIRKMNSLCYE